MKIYEWEKNIRDLISGYPRTGQWHSLMEFMSYPGLLGWALWLTLLAVAFQRNFLRVRIPIVLGLFAAGLGDLISRRLVKALVLRPRPGFIQTICSTPVHCAGMVSSHATNIMAFVTVLCLFNWKHIYWGAPIVFFVSISRIYLLDHYPLDVIGGFLLGFFIGYCVWFIFTKISARTGT